MALFLVAFKIQRDHENYRKRSDFEVCTVLFEKPPTYFPLMYQVFMILHFM